uniref:molybdopterin biosynthesis protein n=1 Tax=Sahlingia subintegra TaxID=468936 RepID=UPI001FCE1612|nr:molybdopterin biosynthesis protein [Sahlingia subintegra]UNJ17254.1 molybdopterin biosynthesis protein [Sahlingia subintegra]
MLDPITINTELSVDEYKRYSRHLVLEEVGKDGQYRLKKSKILIIGLGGLGCLAAMYLASAGIGQLGIVDYDIISLSNLQRQILYNTQLVQQKKCDAAKLQLEKINPNCRIVVFETKINTQNALAIAADYDIILDASDNFSTRYLLSDISVMLNKPIVYGAIFGTEGQVSVFNYRGGPNYRDLLYDRLQDSVAFSCSEGGVMGGVAAIISSLQTNEVLKIILGLRNIISGKLLLYDFVKVKFKTISINKQKISCRQSVIESLKLLEFEEVESGLVKNRFSYQDIVSSELPSHMSNKKCLLIDVRSSQEYQSVHLTSARSIPLTVISDQASIELLRSSINSGYYILIYCSHDSRSIAAMKILKENQICALRLKAGMKGLGF